MHACMHDHEKFKVRTSYFHDSIFAFYPAARHSQRLIVVRLCTKCKVQFHLCGSVRPPSLQLLLSTGNRSVLYADTRVQSALSCMHAKPIVHVCKAYMHGKEYCGFSKLGNIICAINLLLLRLFLTGKKSSCCKACKHIHIHDRFAYIGWTHEIVMHACMSSPFSADQSLTFTT
jgi:hypothetical protein